MHLKNKNNRTKSIQGFLFIPSKKELLTIIIVSFLSAALFIALLRLDNGVLF